MEKSSQDEKSKYFKYQFDISSASELYGSNSIEHGSKIVTLFAEVYAHLVAIYGTDVTKDAMLKFENSEHFKNWFWDVKHRLGTIIMRDPQFYDIGLWLGKGLFLKIILSTVKFNELDLSEENLTRMVDRQNRLIEVFIRECDKKFVTSNIISRTNTGYTLLGENVCVNNCNDIYEINLI